jgi:sterol desaturase/sphingolipid hydroxylase (fatty acid hydroxylase superfamily)
MSDIGSGSDTVAGKPPRASQISPLVVSLLLGTSLLFFVLLLSWNWVSGDVRQGCDALLGGMLGERGCTAAANKIFTYTWAFALIPILLVLERLAPADEDQPLFSRGLLVDAVWFATFPILGVWLINAFEHVLAATAGHAFGDLRLQVLAGLPVWGQLLIVILLSDFLSWFTHLLRHKIPTLWEFHKIHHSQTQLNLFSPRRLHPGDQIATALIRFLPWTLLSMTYAVPGWLAWSIVVRMWEMVVHSNLRTNLGPLRYVLVTPQTHRIHHSLMARHIDKNFGNFFSIWDFMFKTQSMDFHIYPKLGINDEQCSKGGASTVWGALGVFVRELVYPLRSLRALYSGRASTHTPPAPLKKVSEV